MFWADRITDVIRESFAKKIAANEKLVIRDEKTLSGRVHVGSMRGVAIHGVVSRVLSERGVKNEFFYEFNDIDPMDGLPVYLSKDVFEPHMGKPLLNIPSPEPPSRNYPEHFGAEFRNVIESAGFHPTFYNVSELYRSGRMDDVIRTALERAADIRRIYKEVSGSVKPDDWLPLFVICENCGKVSTTRAYAFDGEKVSYRCEPDAVAWTRGCAHEGAVSPFGGRAKLPFKVDWPAKWKVMGVDIEGGGKDHSTKGGTRDVAEHLAREVFDYQPPFNIPYEFFLVGGKKMSSSKGQGSTAREIASLVPPHIFRLALIGKDINQQANFDPSGDTIPVLFDAYDKLAEKAWSGIEDDDVRVFDLIHPEGDARRAQKRFLPRFSQVAFIVQMPHMDPAAETAALKGSALAAEDLRELDERARYAKQWLAAYAPEKFRFELKQELPESARALSVLQKQALKEIAAYLENLRTGEELHAYLHELKSTLSIPPAELFSAIYLAFLGRSDGPKAGWFLSVLERDFVLRRLREASA
jgi:lysyl-tRNA synthetase class 1